MVEAERRMIRTGRSVSASRRGSRSAGPDQAKPYLDLGVRHFCMGWDVEILFEWFKREGEVMRKILERPLAMRAAFYEGARRFVTGTFPDPTPEPGEALLRVRRVGICGTDLHIFQGHLDHRVPQRGIIGHETFAEVAEAPAGSGFASGDRVVVEPLWFCGECRACTMGATFLCYRLKVRGVDMPGGMQEYWPVPTARLLHVPPSSRDDDAAVIEPLAIAVHDVRRAQVQAGDSRPRVRRRPDRHADRPGARHRGARVVVSELNPFRLDMLRGSARDRRPRGRGRPSSSRSGRAAPASTSPSRSRAIPRPSAR